jgi:ribosomal protein L37AE/L43A
MANHAKNRCPKCKAPLVKRTNKGDVHYYYCGKKCGYSIKVHTSDSLKHLKQEVTRLKLELEQVKLELDSLDLESPAVIDL